MAMVDEDLIIDQWAGFNHKHSMGEGGVIDTLVPKWAGKEHYRRLRGYITAAGYRETVARMFLNPEDVTVKEIWREHGDPAAFTDRLSDATLGDDITLRIIGADVHLPEFPIHDPEPAELEADASNVRRRSHAALTKVWELEAIDAIEEWEATHLVQLDQRKRQEWLRKWSHDEKFEAKLREAETELITPLGDAVFVFSVEAGEAPSVRIWEPDAYFPVFPADEVVEFPDKVHLAYQYEVSEGGETTNWLRRITYEVATKVDENSGSPITTTYPYCDERGGKVESEKACFMSDGHWQLDGSSQNHLKTGVLSNLDDLSDDKARWATTEIDGEEVEVRDLDLNIHFMPVVHAPSDLATLTHFGRSAYVRLAQLFDEIAQNDTDAGRAADLTGKPVIGLSGGRLDDKGSGAVTYQAGSVLDMGDNGKLDKLEMADALEALIARGKDLRRLLSTVGAVPEGIMGHVQANQIATGISINLTFTPFRQVINRRRLARLPKVELMLKMVQRMAIVAQDETLGNDLKCYPATVVFGTYIPTDRNALVDMITALADRDLMTPNLAFALLEESGIELGEIEPLVHALRRNRTDKAADLVAIAGRKYAQTYLGIEEHDVGEDPDYGDTPQAVEVPDRDSQEPEGEEVGQEPPQPT